MDASTPPKKRSFASGLYKPSQVAFVIAMTLTKVQIMLHPRSNLAILYGPRLILQRVDINQGTLVFNLLAVTNRLDKAFRGAKSHKRPLNLNICKILCVNWQHRVHPLELCLIVFCLPAPPS